MTSVPTLSFPAMESNMPDEHMDFGTDIRHDQDVDFDVASMRDISRGPSMEPIQDVMIDDAQEVHYDNVQTTDMSKRAGDDEMLDEDFMEEDNNIYDAVEEDRQSATMYDDADLLYEDEEPSVTEPVEIVEESSNHFASNDYELATEDYQHAEASHVDNLEQNTIHGDPSPRHEGDEAAPEGQDLQAVTDDDPGADVYPGEDQDLNKPKSEPIPTQDVENAGLEQGVNAANVIEDQDHEYEAGAEIHQNETNELQAKDTDVQDTNGSKEQTAGAASYDVNSLHPVKVQYDEAELSLFPPLEGTQTFFLEDASLAFVSCEQLLNACRDVLADSTDGDELVLDIPSLGLHLSQGSSYVKQLTLAQILDVYLALNQNDQDVSPPPMFCILRARVSLASQYAYLLSAAAEGKGYSAIRSEFEEIDPSTHASYDQDQDTSNATSNSTAVNDPPEAGQTSESNIAADAGHASNILQNADPSVLVPDGPSEDYEDGESYDDLNDHADAETVATAGVDDHDENAGYPSVYDSINETSLDTVSSATVQGIEAKDFASEQQKHDVEHDSAYNDFEDGDSFDEEGEDFVAEDQEELDLHEVPVGESAATNGDFAGFEDEEKSFDQQATETDKATPAPSVTEEGDPEPVHDENTVHLTDSSYHEADGPSDDTGATTTDNVELDDEWDEPTVGHGSNKLHSSDAVTTDVISAKRKAVDEDDEDDDFNFIDPTTPEKKKHRLS